MRITEEREFTHIVDLRSDGSRCSICFNTVHVEARRSRLMGIGQSPTFEEWMIKSVSFGTVVYKLMA